METLIRTRKRKHSPDKLILKDKIQFEQPIPKVKESMEWTGNAKPEQLGKHYSGTELSMGTVYIFLSHTFWSQSYNFPETNFHGQRLKLRTFAE